MSKSPSEQTPEQRIKELEKQMKAHFFERVVDLMKEDYGIEIKSLSSTP